MKRVLILVLSTDKPPYDSLYRASRDTWDSQEVEGVETIFYFAATAGKQTDAKNFYATCDDDYWNMGRKTLQAFAYALANREWDYVFRANASLYVDKAGLSRYVQNWPVTDLALGVVADCGHVGDERFPFLWGPSYMLSRDVVEKIVANQSVWNHAITDDLAVSLVLGHLNVPLDNRGSMASIAMSKGWYEITYYEKGASGGATLYSLSQLKERLPGQFAFRVKTDSDRTVDIRLMKELWKIFA